jgi:hypothetical protein
MDANGNYEFTKSDIRREAEAFDRREQNAVWRESMYRLHCGMDYDTEVLRALETEPTTPYPAPYSAVEKEENKLIPF